MKIAITKDEMYRLVELKRYADTLSELINELAGEADHILGDSRMNSHGDDLIWNSSGELVEDWLTGHQIEVADAPELQEGVF
jgi:predicted CopG family antitoxin